MRKRAFDEHGDQSPNPWDFSHSGRNSRLGRQAAPLFQHRPRRSGSIPGGPYPPWRLIKRNTAVGKPKQRGSFFSCRTAIRYGINIGVLASRKWPVLK